ncbi:leucyl/phenylalanyl-tRNA--protein transferase [Pseudogemmobacter blasticus]|uniref:Leucyl/phenylalanyl-tRNA--protein transferase n=1 Tax=Fuscovulum blasticum DSM 2131 TaxID=1188250 RepID=A0A2T4J5Y1_FUSBL|nr:leucyl/phenylalanyl-tRNA--protein transferase [Fuscovulum blasticum]PTE13309.1 leucyl/phenylalanyl-tRNA--protein transferase [Fuscovulum blasticum DSM 2131]
MDAALLTPDHLLRGYAMGIFPMAQSRDDPQVHWLDPRQRGILPLDGFHISRSLAQRIRRAQWQVRADTDFEAVVRGCADREETWISDRILALYLDLHRRGFAHSIEVWDGPDLVGGVYGVVLGAAFFGESMFSRRTDASKLALAWTVHRLQAGGFTLFDTQFLTPHLASLGAVEIPREVYHRRLARALQQGADFAPPGYCPSPSEVAASSSGGVSTTSGGV